MSINTIKHVCIIMAMEGEAMPLIDVMRVPHVARLHPSLPPHYYQKQMSGLLITIVVMGKDERYAVDWVGTEMASVTTQIAIDVLKPDLVISAGTAGGFSAKGSEIGSIVLSEKNFIYHDHHVPLAGFDKSGIGNYPGVDVSRIVSEFQWQSGVISSGSSLRKTAEDVAVLTDWDAMAKDMESTAVAGMCMLNQVPCFALRSITNLVDQTNDSEDEFQKNFVTAVDSLTNALNSVITFIAGKSLAELAES